MIPNVATLLLGTNLMSIYSEQIHSLPINYPQCLLFSFIMFSHCENLLALLAFLN